MTLFKRNFEREVKQMFKQATLKGLKPQTIKKKFDSIYDRYELLLAYDSDHKKLSMREFQDLKNKETALEILKTGAFTVKGSYSRIKVDQILKVGKVRDEFKEIKCQIVTHTQKILCDESNYDIVSLLI